MGYLPVTIIAYLLNATAVTIDKFLLTKHIPNPLIYVFYFSLVSCVALVLLPFAPLPSFEALILSSVSTLLWTVGAYFMFKALQEGQVSRVIPVIGTLIPLFLLVAGLIEGNVTVGQGYAIGILVLGLIFLTIFDWRGKVLKKEVFLELSSAGFFAASYLILKFAYEVSNFWTVFVYSRPILIPVGLTLLLIPQTRRIIFPKNPEQSRKIDWGKLFKSSAVGLFVFGQVSAGVSQLLLNFSISLAEPALVNALQGIQYVFLFAVSLVLGRKYPQVFGEENSRIGMLAKLLGIVCISIGLFLLAQEN